MYSFYHLNRNRRAVYLYIIATMLSLRFLNFYFYNRWNSLALVPFVALNRAKNIRPEAMSLDITNI